MASQADLERDERISEWKFLLKHTPRIPETEVIVDYMETRVQELERGR